MLKQVQHDGLGYKGGGLRRYATLFAGMTSLAVASPSLAQEDLSRPVSSAKSVGVFWRYVNCVARFQPKAVDTLLAEVYWSDEQIKAARQLAERSNFCALLPGDMMRMNPVLFRGSLASVMVVRRYAGAPLPDFSSLPPRFAGSLPFRPEDQQRTVLLSFAECVTRARTAEVFRLLAAEPLSEGERAAWSALDPVLSGCLPADPGTQLRFSRVGLKSLLGEAAYELDRLSRSGQQEVSEAAE